MKTKAVLFDLDGTLIDTSEFIFQAYEHALKTHGHNVVDRKELSPHIGRGLHTIYSEIAPGGIIEDLIKTHISFQDKKLHLIKTYPNILKTIKKIKKLGYKIGIVTSRLKNTDDALKTAGIDPKLFEVIITASDVKNPKPHPEGVIKALKKLKVKVSEAIMIGDASVDIEMGKNAKVKTVGVTYGFGGQGIKNSSPDFVIDDIEELLDILR